MAMIVATSPFDQKTESDPLDMIID